MPTAPTVPASDAEKVYAWKVEQLSRLGYPPARAAVLADRGIDVHQLARLIRHGCPPDLAVKIVL